MGCMARGGSSPLRRMTSPAPAGFSRFSASSLSRSPSSRSNSRSNKRRHNARRGRHVADPNRRGSQGSIYACKTAAGARMVGGRPRAVARAVRLVQRAASCARSALGEGRLRPEEQRALVRWRTRLLTRRSPAGLVRRVGPAWRSTMDGTRIGVIDDANAATVVGSGRLGRARRRSPGGCGPAGACACAARDGSSPRPELQRMGGGLVAVGARAADGYQPAGRPDRRSLRERAAGQGLVPGRHDYRRAGPADLRGAHGNGAALPGGQRVLLCRPRRNGPGRSGATAQRVGDRRAGGAPAQTGRCGPATRASPRRR